MTIFVEVRILLLLLMNGLFDMFLMFLQSHPEGNVRADNYIRYICREIGICTITLTGIRHRASTALWGMDASDEQVDCFMEHIGHQKEMDKNVYACPSALRAMQTVTPLLERINTVSFN